MMPSNQAPLYQQEKTVEHVAEQRQGKNPRIHFRDLERALCEQDEVAKAVVGNDHFSEDSQDQRNSETDAHTRQDLRAGGGNDKFAERLKRCKTKSPRRIELDRIDRANAAISVQQY